MQHGVATNRSALLMSRVICFSALARNAQEILDTL